MRAISQHLKMTAARHFVNFINYGNYDDGDTGKTNKSALKESNKIRPCIANYYNR